tara:strand:- start:5140 stop:5670 length:531 start_codon:yes stop_codon:yes gene_type:complete
MNIFVLSEDPITAAKMLCDKHIPKMTVESYQMLGSAARRHGATDDQMPLTKSGTPLVGGYPHHPCTRWAGDSRDNYLWLAHHAAAQAEEYEKRFGKEHFCTEPIEQLYSLAHLIPEDYSTLTPFALAMPDEYKEFDGYVYDTALSEMAVLAYRAYYHSKTFARWERGRNAPAWWSA